MVARLKKPRPVPFITIPCSFCGQNYGVRTDPDTAAKVQTGRILWACSKPICQRREPSGRVQIRETALLGS